MQNETWAAKWVRGLVKTVFIGCYIAFMWASIHHVAAFFNNFEENNGNIVGSYMLAAAFDITALVTTIGVMFFRKSMPHWVFWIVWSFILATAGYSFFINWEYASHYQNITLIMQPTGETTPVYDTAGMLHYVPVMQANTWLQWINPLLASGFTVFSLIYSVIAEFFGTKPPTTEELLAKKQYLEETASLLEEIKKLEGKGKKSLITTIKEAAMEGKEAWKEVTTHEESEEESTEEEVSDTDQPQARMTEESSEETREQADENSEEMGHKRARKQRGNGTQTSEEMSEENLPLWLVTGGSTIALQTVVKHTRLSLKKLRNRVESRVIQATRNKDIVYKASLIEWMKEEGIIRENAKIVHLNVRRNDEEMAEQAQGEEQETGAESMITVVPVTHNGQSNGHTNQTSIL